MQRSQPVPFPVLLAAGLLIAALLMLGPATERSLAASCSGADKPAYSMSDKAAAKATLCELNKERSQRGMKPLKFDGKNAEGRGQAQPRDAQAELLLAPLSR